MIRDLPKSWVSPNFMENIAGKGAAGEFTNGLHCPWRGESCRLDSSLPPWFPSPYPRTKGLSGDIAGCNCLGSRHPVTCSSTRLRFPSPEYRSMEASLVAVGGVQGESISRILFTGELSATLFRLTSSASPAPRAALPPNTWRPFPRSITPEDQALLRRFPDPLRARR